MTHGPDISRRALIAGAALLSVPALVRPATVAPAPPAVTEAFDPGPTARGITCSLQPESTVRGVVPINVRVDPARGIRVGVVSRGYGGKAASYPLLLSNDTSTAEAGDEPVLIFQRTGAPVAVSPARREAVQALLHAHDLQLIITDDGLQHYKLARDKEIVVIDGERRFGNGWWLPAGPMRERASRLRSVDAIIVNGGIAQAGEIPMQLRPGLAVNLRSGERRDVASFDNVVAMAGIGHPPRFFATLESCSVVPVKTVALADHQALTQASVSALVNPQQTLLMTEKDAVKCRGFAESNWWYLPVDAIMTDERAQQLLTELVTLAQR